MAPETVAIKVGFPTLRISKTWHLLCSIVYSQLRQRFLLGGVDQRNRRLRHLSSSSCNSSTLQHTILDSSQPYVFVGPVACGSYEEAEFLPAAFVAFSNGTSTAVVCTPTFQVLNVSARFELSSGAVLESNRCQTIIYPQLLCIF